MKILNKILQDNHNGNVRAMARAIGTVSNVAIHKWLNGKSYPSEKSIQQIARVYEISPTTLRSNIYDA